MSPNLFKPFVFVKDSMRYLPFLGSPAFCKQFAVTSEEREDFRNFLSWMCGSSVIMIPFNSNVY